MSESWQDSCSCSEEEKYILVMNILYQEMMEAYKETIEQWKRLSRQYQQINKAIKDETTFLGVF